MIKYAVLETKVTNSSFALPNGFPVIYALEGTQAAAPVGLCRLVAEALSSRVCIWT